MSQLLEEQILPVVAMERSNRAYKRREEKGREERRRGILAVITDSVHNNEFESK